MPVPTPIRRAIERATPVLALGTAALTAALAACADSPTAPASSPVPAASGVRAGAVTGPVFTKSADHAARKAAKDSAKAAKHSAKDEASHVSEVTLDTLAATWHTAPQDQEPGTDQPVPLACTGQGQFRVTQTIGTKGGVLSLGQSALTIPAGALAHPETITATATAGPTGVQLDFVPHGLQFAKAVELRIDYTGCDATVGTPVNVYYTNATGGIAQVLPSAQAPARQQVRALTDHFSGYIASWGRR